MIHFYYYWSAGPVAAYYVVVLHVATSLLPASIRSLAITLLLATSCQYS
jgi:hypothetical protein